MKILGCRAFFTLSGVSSSTFFIPSVNVIGADSLTDAMNMMADYGFTRTLIVTDNMLTKLGMVGDVQKALEERNIFSVIYDGTQPKEGANKQVISSQADSLIKISRIWADFFPADRISLFELFFNHFWRYFRFLLISPLTYHLVQWLITSPVGYRFSAAPCILFSRSRTAAKDAEIPPRTDAGFRISMLMAVLFLRGCCFKVFTLPGRSAISQSTSTSASSSRCGAPW